MGARTARPQQPYPVPVPPVYTTTIISAPVDPRTGRQPGCSCRERHPRQRPGYARINPNQYPQYYSRLS
jgi:hypothetical protein